MKRRKPVVKKVVTKKPSAAEVHKKDLYREVKDLSTTEVEYRFDENSKKILRSELLIQELLSKLAEARKHLAISHRECEVLAGVLEARR